MQEDHIYDKAQHFKMDDVSSLPELKNYISTLNLHCLKRYNLNELPECLEETLNILLEEKASMKNIFLAELEDEIIIQELGKHPDEMLTVKQAEKCLIETQELIKEIKNMSEREQKHQETINRASDALNTLSEKLAIFSQKIQELEEKILKCQINKNSEKEILLLDAAISEREVLWSRLERLQEKLKLTQTITAQTLDDEATLKKVLNVLQAEVESKVEYSGISYRLVSQNSLELEFKSDSFVQLNDTMSEIDVTQDLKLVVILKFSKQLRLTDVQLNQPIDVRHLINAALADNDFLKLILELSKFWRSQTTLISEISLLRKRHAIDWIPERNVLLLIVKQQKSCVCSLKVPSSYPHSGQISLESVLGHPSGLTADEVTTPPDSSLRGWLKHLDDFFGQAQERLSQFPANS
ncbi:hypothetical protein Btru_067439 [Bulinus truncatus]|nr:hypothetical protein Btru_067439 [Bulinus truncatus]